VHPVFELDATSDRLINDVVVLLEASHEVIIHFVVKVEHLWFV